MTHNIQVRVKYFAAVREALGNGHASWPTQATTVGTLRAELMARDAQHAEALGPGRAVRTAHNQVLCGPETLLHEGDEVAFFPPVTGG